MANKAETNMNEKTAPNAGSSAKVISDLQQQQLDALELANKQQLDALAQQRELALESAKYWDNAAKEAMAGQPEAQTAAFATPHVSSTVLTEAHFTCLESVLKAQVDFVRTIVTSSTK